jgi:hypothetical protein
MEGLVLAEGEDDLVPCGVRVAQSFYDQVGLMTEFRGGTVLDPAIGGFFGVPHHGDAAFGGELQVGLHGELGKGMMRGEGCDQTEQQGCECFGSMLHR